MGPFVIAVDVGTGSARAGLYDGGGRLHGRAEAPLALWRKGARLAQYSSDDIWNAVCHAVRGAVTATGTTPDEIAGLAFDATCSLVILDAEGRPLTASPDPDAVGDTISWFDHRAIDEAAELATFTGPALDHAGGSFSPELQIPKLLWLKRHHPETWRRAGLVLDLADYLAYRATGSTRRSLSTLVTKWSYLPHRSEPWDLPFLSAAGLGDLIDRAGITGEPGEPGDMAGRLSAAAAADLGLSAGVPVAFGMVDAFAGALSVLGAGAADPGDAALIGGTSTCLMWASAAPHHVDRFWGPFRDAIAPGNWVTEGGQSAAGALLDHLIATHGGGLPVGPASHERILTRIGEMLQDAGTTLGASIHVLPDFHGNRSPKGDPAEAGLIAGLGLDSSFDGLCRLYWRAMVGIALGIRQIIAAREPIAGPVTRLHLAGGHARNPLFAQLYADATGLPVILSAGDEGMLLGSAMLAARAAGWQHNLAAAHRAMRRPDEVVVPDPGHHAALSRDYAVFLRLQSWRALAGDDIGA